MHRHFPGPRTSPAGSPPRSNAIKSPAGQSTGRRESGVNPQASSCEAFSITRKGAFVSVLRWAKPLTLSLLFSWLSGCGVTTPPPPPPAPPTDSGAKAAHPFENVIPLSDAVIKQWVGIVMDAAELNVAPLRQVIVEQQAFASLWNSWRKGEEPPEVDFDSQFVVAVADQNDTFV